jgi:MFS family permease
VAVPQLRPLSLGEILDVAINLCWSRARVLLPLVALVLAPVELVSALVEVSTPQPARGGVFSGGDSRELTPHEFRLYLAGTLASLLLTLVATQLTTGACFKVVADAYLGGRPTLGSALRFVSRRLHSLLWILVLTFLGVVLGLILCVVPGIYLWVGWSLALPALLTENVRGCRALGRSRALVRGTWWRTFGLLLVGFLLAGIASALIVAVSSPLVDRIGRDSVAGVIVAVIFATIGAALTQPFAAAFVGILYFDLRVRKEGFDLQLLAERMGLPPGAELPPEALAPAPPPTTPGGGAWPPLPPLAPGQGPVLWPPPPSWLREQEQPAKPRPEPEPGTEVWPPRNADEP